MQFNKYVTCKGEGVEYVAKKGMSPIQIVLSFFYVRQSFLFRFLWNSGNITPSNKKNTYKSLCIQENYIIFAQKFYNSISLLTCVVYVCKNAIEFKDAIFYLLWYNVIQCLAIYTKNRLFSHSVVCYFYWITKENVIE